MDAAEPARRHHLDAQRTHGRERSADGRRAERALHATGCEVARTDLARGRAGIAEAPQLGRAQPDDEHAVEDADGRRDGARGAHRRLGRLPHDDALALREAVSHERRLEADDRPAARQRIGDLGCDAKRRAHGSAPTRVTQRAAAAWPRWAAAEGSLSSR